MSENEALLLFKCLSDRSRLQILKSLAIEDMHVERLAQRLGLTPPTVSFHLKKLAEAGAVKGTKSQYYMVYSLNRELFRREMLSILLEQSEEAEEQQRRDDEYRQKVLESFFVDGRLVSIPAQRKKESIILEHIAESFQPGREYSEREVNIIIADFHDDFCTIRRDMIAEKLLSREDGVYRKI